jgi:hypothetical protein
MKGELQMKKLFIEGRRNGYGPDQCGSTMTVGELIDFLKDFDEETEVFLKNDNGYTYGNIDTWSFEESEEEGEEDEL